MIDYKQFVKEAGTFREYMTDSRNPIDLIDRAFGCLFVCICNLDIKDAHMADAEAMWDAAMIEWTMRKRLMVMRGHPLTDTGAPR